MSIFYFSDKRCTELKQEEGGRPVLLGCKDLYRWENAKAVFGVDGSALKIFLSLKPMNNCGK